MVGDVVREFLDAEVAGTGLETCAWGTRLTGRIKVDITRRSGGGSSSG
jgi:glycerol-3-phosphate acyltransferase